MKHLIKFNENKFSEEKIEDLSTLWIDFCQEFSDESSGLNSFINHFGGISSKEDGDNLLNDAETVLKSLQRKLDKFRDELSK